MKMLAVPLVLALLGAPAIAFASAPAAERVLVEGDEIAIMKQEKLDTIAVEATKLAEQAGIAPHEMSVSLVWADRGELVYGIRVRIATDEAKLVDPADERGPIVQRCADCSEADLVTASIEGVLEAIQQYQEAKQPEPAPAAEPEPEPVVAPPDAAAQPMPADRVGGLGPLGQAGVATIVIGASAVIAGAVLIGVDTTRPAANPTVLREFRPSGYAVLGVGAAVLFTGAVLLGVDRRNAKQRKTAMAPLLVPGFVGLAAEGRF